MLDLTVNEMIAFRAEAMPLLEQLKATVHKYVGDDEGIYATLSGDMLALGSYERHWAIEDTADRYSLIRGPHDHISGYKNLACLREPHKDSEVA